MPDFYEFFAGAGMARAGLGEQWNCLFANDYDQKKSASYRLNWGDRAHDASDVRILRPQELPGRADLVWASFPCQDLSLAGGGAGLQGARSGTFWPFWSLIKELVAQDRSPRIIALENVCGALSSHDGKDFAAICAAFEQLDYNFGALVIDACHFVPQSRPRLFFIGAHGGSIVPPRLVSKEPSTLWLSRALLKAYETTPAQHKRNWIWWTLPTPSARNSSFAQLVEDNPSDVDWYSSSQTRSLVAKMSKVNLAKLDAVKNSGRRVVGTIYKRTRVAQDGSKAQRAEVRFDDIAGCLRTPAGGSSRQVIVVVEGDKVRSRLISGRETARLMGLPDSYQLPKNYNEAYHLTGDGVVVDVVRHLARNIFEPLLADSKMGARHAA